jgi:DNA modification methylase
VPLCQKHHPQCNANRRVQRNAIPSTRPSSATATPAAPPASSTAKASKADRDEQVGGRIGAARWRDADNNHPTVKPTDLMRWLARLVTPQGGTILDPFTGSGSTGKAARLEGFGFVGIEREPEYADIARARIAAVEPMLIGGVG